MMLGNVVFPLEILLLHYVLYLYSKQYTTISKINIMNRNL